MAHSRDEKTEDRGNSFTPVIITVCVFLLILFIGFFIALHSSLFNITTVSVYGLSRYTEQDIISLSGITEDTNIVDLDENAAKQAIEQNPYLTVKKIKRTLFPVGVEIYVTERTSAAQIYTQNGYYIIDKECVALALLSSNDPTLPTIYNLGIAEPTFGTPISLDSEDKLISLQSVLEAIEKYQFSGHITGIDVSTPNRISLTYENTFTILLAGPATVDKKLSRLSAIIAASADKLIAGSTLNLETEDNYYIKQGK